MNVLPQKPAKIVVGLSGGVDSAVCAALLKAQNHEVTGVFMQNWDANDPNCTAEVDLSDARAICDQLNIPFKVINFSKEYWETVFQYCLEEFRQGRTPNPDIWCNKEIKFKVFLDYALALGADFLATGHYAQNQFKNNQFYLTKSVDTHKDQTYFLYTLGQAALSRALFPLGNLPKSKVRDIAKNLGLINHAKKDSTGICFIGERKFKDFLAEFLLAKPGDIQTVDGQTIGRHDGIMFYTLGQRKGLHIGGQRNQSEAPWYVVDKEIQNNILIVGQGHDHPKLLTKTLICNALHWVSKEPPVFPFYCQAKIRYLQMDQTCEVHRLSDQLLEVHFNQAQRAVTPGQSIVFYKEEICLGGGTICRSS